MEIVKPDGMVEDGAELIVQRLEIGLRICLLYTSPQPVQVLGSDTRKIPVVAVLNPGRLPLAPHEYVKALTAMPVSYTHLDVYKRQVFGDTAFQIFKGVNAVCPEIIESLVHLL